MTRAIPRSIAVLSMLPASLFAGEWDVTGYAGLSTRVFSDDEQLHEQHGGSAHALRVQSEFYWQGNEGRARFGTVAYGRLDSEDDERTDLDLREASAGFVGGDWDLNVGIDKVFWGVTESRHLVDVINQTDLVEDIDEEAKLGQPMINLNLNRDFGRIELYLLPRFRERTFPGLNGRLRAPLPVDADAAIFESRDGKRHRDVSLRYSHYFGSFDVGANVFQGTSREPRFELAADALTLVPYYEQVKQYGIDLQRTGDASLWKLEAIARDAASDSFVAAVAGIEHTFFGVKDSAADVGVLFEYLYDGRNGNATTTSLSARGSRSTTSATPACSQAPLSTSTPGKPS
jgi:hypothetical protein